MQTEHTQLVRDKVLDEAHFRRLTLKGALKGEEQPWRRVVVRPVMLKGGRHLQFSYFDERRDTTKNYRGEEAEAKLDELLALPFSVLNLEAGDGNIVVQRTGGGKSIVHRKAVPATPPPAPSLEHDRAKALPLPPGKPDAFLGALGITNAAGQVRPGMHSKLQQINDFLKLMEHTGEIERIEARPLNILDCGCGSSYLSFAAYHYLNNVRGVPARMVGIDVNEELIAKSNRRSEELGMEDICFTKAAIAQYVPDVEPHIVLALHACDTATDDALALGVKSGARLILSVPCCHHHLHAQLEAREPFEPVMREGILRKRLADILTDTFRTLALRAAGYRVDAVEFVSQEHTDRNLMIRAVKREGAKRDEAALQEYKKLKDFWGVEPYIETIADFGMRIAD
jgi:SAM-dependent methyltransferase